MVKGKVTSKVDSKVTSKVDSNEVRELNATQRRIVELMKEEPGITIAKLSELIGIGNSGIKKNIVKLKELGVVERLGSDKTGSWKVNE